MTTASHDIDESVSHIRQLLDTAKATQRPSDARLVDEALRMLEAEELLAVSERRVQIGHRLKGGVSHDALAKLRVWVDEAKRTARELRQNEERLARETASLDEMLRNRRAIAAAEEARIQAQIEANTMSAMKLLEPMSDLFKSQIEERKVHLKDLSMSLEDEIGAAKQVSARRHELQIALTRNQQAHVALLTPEEYEAALACEVSDTEIYNAIDQAMREALASRAPFFRVSVPSSALERAKAMLVKWDVQESPKPTMREGAVYLAHLKVSPRVPAFEVFLVGDVVVVAEDADNARLLTSSMTSDPRMRQLLLEGFESVEPRQVDSSEVLEVYLWDGHGGAPVTHSAGEWAKTQGRGVLGLIMGSALEKKFRAREHREECNGVPCYCEDAKRQADGEYFDAARENHLYFIGPNLYVAESEEAALKYHHVGVIDNTAKLEELRKSILEEAPSEVEMASRHVDAVFAEVSKVYAIRRVAEDEMLPEIVELSEFKEAVQVSDKTYNDWRSGKMGSVGLLRSYYQEVITPHVEAIMAAAAVAGERRLQEVREKLGIGDGLTVTREDNGGS